MAIWLERIRRRNSNHATNPPGHLYVRFPSILFLFVFLTSVVCGGSTFYWILKKDNELEKSRRIELELRNNIKERDYVIQQYRQQIKQLERRVEIMDAIKELSSNSLSLNDQKRIAERIDVTSDKYGHDPYLILAMIAVESSIQPESTSPTGAKGLMQLMPSTGQYLSRQVKQSPKIIGIQDNKDFDVPHYFNLEGNIELGTLYLTQLLVRYQSLEHALYAYNMGPNLFEKRLKEGGPYPRHYLSKVLNKYAQLTVKRRSNPEEAKLVFYSTRDLGRLLAQADVPAR
jgi:soluble lytic murein transglycosylase